jgi:GNAT superfamily N-acetyltransferase
MSETRIRALTAADKAEWLRLWAGYLAFYEQDLAPEVTETLFDRLLGADGHFGFVAERDGRLVGFVHALPHASTWSVAPTCYLEDLYVDDAVRGSGSGRKLIEAVYAKAGELGCSNVYWHTHDNNARARQLYDRIGSLSNFVRYDRPTA